MNPPAAATADGVVATRSGRLAAAKVTRTKLTRTAAVNTSLIAEAVAEAVARLRMLTGLPLHPAPHRPSHPARTQVNHKDIKSDFPAVTQRTSMRCLRVRVRPGAGAPLDSQHRVQHLPFSFVAPSGDQPGEKRSEERRGLVFVDQARGFRNQH